MVDDVTASTHHGGKNKMPVLMLGALGVVFGDIGTSPLYALRECFLSAHHRMPVTHEKHHHDSVCVNWSLCFYALCHLY